MSAICTSVWGGMWSAWLLVGLCTPRQVMAKCSVDWVARQGATFQTDESTGHGHGQVAVLVPELVYTSRKCTVD